MKRPQPEQAWMLREELDEYFKQLPTSIAGNVFNALICAAYFSWYTPGVWIVSYVLVFVSATWLRYNLKKNYETTDIPDENLPKIIRKAQLHVAALALIWGSAMAGLTLAMTSAQAAFVGMLAAGMMSAATLTLTALPGGVTIYVGIVGAFILSAMLWLATPISLIGAGLLLSYAMVQMNYARVLLSGFKERLLSEREVATHAETIKLVLHQYEEDGSDWIWELNDKGAIANPSVRFADAAGRPLETLEGTPFLELFANGPETRSLASHIAHGQALRNFAVPLQVAGERKWWSLSGRQMQQAEDGVLFRGVATDITAAKNAEAHITYMAHYDGLTGLANRILFQDALNHALNEVGPSRQAAVLSIDLDHFKAVNDTLGHPTGDALLKVVARRISSCVKSRDVVARMGGDEFAILLTQAESQQEVSEIASRILHKLSQNVNVERHEVLCGASVGALMISHGDESAEVILKKVDLALYAAKNGGRNRISFYEAGMDEIAQARRLIEFDLRLALQRDELSLHYQPLVDVASGVTVAYEALLRWVHPTRGLIMPTEFVTIAEETGLIVPLGEWVIRKAIAEAATWPEHVSISVNLSPNQMRSPNLISTITAALASSGMSPSRLEMEVTETILMSDSEIHLATLRKIKALGVKIALDDFGTGYSSLNYLRTFPFDKIKIDRCFIQDIGERDDCQAIVRSVIDLASRLGMVTTAEGVETAEQLAQLRTNGCDQAQGFLFSKALPPAELTDLRRQSGKWKRPQLDALADSEVALLKTVLESPKAVMRSDTRKSA
ncbi:MAG: EAL domain-containing protein [Hyphomicrobiales bacterium]|nr:EAL domain-containing protein [Hyphomicrobiales bacterium]